MQSVIVCETAAKKSGAKISRAEWLGRGNRSFQAVCPLALCNPTLILSLDAVRCGGHCLECDLIFPGVIYIWSIRFEVQNCDLCSTTSLQLHEMEWSANIDRENGVCLISGALYTTVAEWLLRREKYSPRELTGAQLQGRTIASIRAALWGGFAKWQKTRE